MKMVLEPYLKENRCGRARAGRQIPKSGECRDKIIRKILEMKLTPADLTWLAEGLMDIVSEMDDEGIDYSNEVKV